MLPTFSIPDFIFYTYTLSTLTILFLAWCLYFWCLYFLCNFLDIIFMNNQVIMMFLKQNQHYRLIFLLNKLLNTAWLKWRKPQNLFKLATTYFIIYKWKDWHSQDQNLRKHKCLCQFKNHFKIYWKGGKFKLHSFKRHLQPLNQKISILQLAKFPQTRQTRQKFGYTKFHSFFPSKNSVIYLFNCLIPLWLASWELNFQTTSIYILMN